MDLHEHLLFPFRDPDWVRKLLLGCIITLIPVVNILALGYFIACLDMGLKGRQILPEWHGWPEMLSDGLQGLIICLAYLGIPIILTFALLAVPGVGSLLAALIFLLLGMLLPVALAAFSVSRDLRDAFRFKDILYQASLVLNEYIFAYLVTMFVMCLGVTINLAAPLLAVVGSLLIFYTGAVFCDLVGLLLRDQAGH